MFGKKKDPAGDDNGTLADQMANLASLNTRHRADAENKRVGMTLAELDRFVHEALSQGCGDNTPVMTQVNITGGIKAVWTREEKTNGSD